MYQNSIYAELCTRKYVINITQVKKGASQQNDEAAIIVLDGTYINIQKSADYAFQRMQIDVTDTLLNICVCACLHYNVL